MKKTRDYILNYLTDDDIINNEIYLAKTYPNKLKQMITHNMLERYFIDKYIKILQSY